MVRVIRQPEASILSAVQGCNEAHDLVGGGLTPKEPGGFRVRDALGDLVPGDASEEHADGEVGELQVAEARDGGAGVEFVELEPGW